MNDVLLDADSSDIKPSIQYAGFWMKVAATFIDSIALCIIILPLYFVLVFPYLKELLDIQQNALNATGIDPAKVQDLNSKMTLNIIIYYIITLFIYIGYYGFMESSKIQGTLGKMALGLKVVNTNYTKISFAKAVGRFFARMISSFILGFGYFMAGWNKNKQCLHDKICKTYVIYK